MTENSLNLESYSECQRLDGRFPLNINLVFKNLK